MHELNRLEHMSKEQREAYILALKPPATATEEECLRFELLRQIALGRKLTDAEREAFAAIWMKDFAQKQLKIKTYTGYEKSLELMRPSSTSKRKKAPKTVDEGATAS